MAEPFRWAILGAGRMAAKWASDLSHVPGSHLQAVWARDGAKARAFSEQFGHPAVEPDLPSLLSRRDLDAVYVASPHGLHQGHVQLCLEAGLPVLCEKAFALDLHQAQSMVDLARQRRVFLMEALWTRFLPGFRAALDLARSGDLGSAVSLSADFGFVAPYAPTSRLWDPAMGGGSLLDIGLYPLFFALSFLGPVHGFQAHLERAPNGVDQAFSGRFRHGGDAISSLRSTFLESTPCQAAIEFEKGTIRFGRMFHTPVDVLLTRGPEEIRLAGTCPGNGYQFETIHAQECIRGGMLESPDWPLEATLGLMGLLDRIRADAT